VRSKTLMMFFIEYLLVDVVAVVIVVGTVAVVVLPNWKDAFCRR
jgi:Tfp pilus assembly protein PilE